jgi:hypothetical protein
VHAEARIGRPEVDPRLTASIAPAAMTPSRSDPNVTGSAVRGQLFERQ